MRISLVRVFRLSAVVLWFLLGTSAARAATAAAAAAAEWVSPDGQIAIPRPSEARFTIDPSVEAPGLIRWVSADSATIVVVVHAPAPSDQSLDPRGLEQGTLNQLQQGRVLSSTTSSISGVPAYTIIASGNIAGAPNYLAQTIVVFDGKLYKVVVASASDPRDDADVAPMLQSLRILAPSPVGPRAAAGPSGRRGGQHELSVTLAQWAIGLLLAALVVALIRKRDRPRQTPLP